MKNTFGNAVSLTIFGESHGPAIGAVLDGIAPGIPVDETYLAAQMDKRRARGGLSTARKEGDRVELLSGVHRGHTTGTPITFLIRNENTRSGDYEKTRELLRPGHADYTAHAKYLGWQDARGGGHFSGRLTAPVVAAGALCQSILLAHGVYLGTHVARCGGVRDAAFAPEPEALARQLHALNKMSELAVLDSGAARRMRMAIEEAAHAGDSVGGLLETAVLGLPAGVGEPFFDSVESVLSHLLFSIPAVKGVEFGSGFALADLRGSEANDPFCLRGGKVATTTNHNGGINGGITNGMPLVVRTVVKPTPSIYQKQQTVDFDAMQPAELQIEGRHDPCILHRARVVQDSVISLGLVDLLSQRFGTLWQGEGF